MPRFSFVGGIHPYDGKDLTKDKEVKKYIPKGDLVFPLQQHVGAPAVPVVKKGDKVLVGQLIAKADGNVSANIHSSVSGIVKGIEKRKTPVGTEVKSIIVENDNQYAELMIPDPKALELLPKSDIISLIKEAGVVGMGGAGFPTHVKLSPKNPGKIDYVIVNCSECEPYLTSDYRRMLEIPDQLVEGLRIILRLFDNARGILAIEDNKPECIKALKKLVATDERINVVSLKTKYPQGAERFLIYAVTGRAIGASVIPADAGCVVNNVDTVIAVRNAVISRKPLTKRIITVSGDNIKEPCNFEVPIGTSYSELIEAAGGFVTEGKKVISGGPMMGFALSTLDVPVCKTSSAIVALKNDDVASGKETACINCGRCVDICPGRIVPSRVADAAASGNKERFKELFGLECCECGSCSYICPAKRPLTQSIKSMKRIVLDEAKAKEQSKAKEQREKESKEQNTDIEIDVETVADMDTNIDKDIELINLDAEVENKNE